MLPSFRAKDNDPARGVHVCRQEKKEARPETVKYHLFFLLIVTDEGGSVCVFIGKSEF